MTELTPQYYKKKFFEENVEYTEIMSRNETIGQIQDIVDNEDEVWLMQCPKGTDISQLVEQKIKLPGRSNVHHLEAVAMEFNESKNHAFGYCNQKGRYQLRLLPVRGNIVVRNKLKASDPVTMEKLVSLCPPAQRVPLPKFIKVRHPLLGAQYENKLQIDEKIQKRLKQADKISIEISREARQNAKKSLLGTQHKEEAQIKIKKELFDSTNGSPSVNKERKRKVSERIEERQSNKTRTLSGKGVAEDLQWLKML